MQTLAPPGGIFISETVRNNVANRKEIKTRLIKEETLKHVKEPIRIYEVVIGAADTSQRPCKSAHIETMKIMPEKSIAVLPFINMTNDPEQEYFSDGK